MTTVSAVIIAKNEEELLPGCLESVRWANEVILLDSGSDDRTLEIAREFGVKAYQNLEWQGFGRQRQLAQTYARCDWVFWIDADERVGVELADEICQCVKRNDQSRLYRVPRLSWFFGRYIRHSGWYPDYVVRLYPRQATGYDDALVHEKVVVPSGLQLETLKRDLFHYTYRDIRQYLEKSASYAALWAKAREGKGESVSLFQAVLHGLGCFIKMYILRAGWLDGKQGFLLALLSSHSTFVKYVDLWSRRQKGRPG